MKEFIEKHDKLTHRIFEMTLGILTWSLLTSPIWLGVIYPKAIVYILTFFTVFWSYLAVKHTIGLIRGYKKYKEEEKIDWYDEYKKLDYSVLPDPITLPESKESIRHMILIPAVNEPESVLRESIDSIFNQTFPVNQIVLVYSIEEKYSKETCETIERIVGDRKSKLYKFMMFVHPFGIEGEAIGAAAANRTWGAKHAVEELKSSGENIRNYIFSTIDSDHVLYPQYISRLTHLYLSTPRRDNHYFSTAVHLFDNNLWRVPMMMRIEANAVTMGSLSDWSASKRKLKDTFSSYSSSLQTLIDANYWDVTLGVDDTIFYWRSLFVRNGDFEGVPHYVPYSADAVEGSNYVDSHIRMYKQLLRWGWGAIDFPLSMKEFLKNEKIPRSLKISWFFKHMERRVILINIVFLITFGFGLVTLVNPYVKQSNFAYSLPDIMSIILTFTLVFLVPGSYLRMKLVKPMPKNWPIYRKALTLMEGPLIMLNLLTYSFIPWVHAQTKMLLGKKMKDLYHTPKVR
ncbi:MAG TPA: glycosyltransferase family 2 protein [bacterium]|jgi:glycosyltransferase involved in cell wall biosynthesis|nr:glycosyltransferase family 2 protein [bacterium]